MSVVLSVETFSAFDGQTLRYAILHSQAEDAVDKSPIVFVPGLGGSVKFALSFLEKFVPSHGPVYSLDPRGFGLNESQKPQPNPAHYLYDFEGFVAHLQEQNLLKRHSAPLLFGLSLGGVYSTLYLSRSHHPFQGAVLLAPAFSPHPDTFSLKFKLETYSRILTKGLKATTTLPYGIRELTRNEDVYTDPHFSEPMVMPSFYMFFVQQLCKKAFAKVHQITVPTALIVPEKDLICNPDTMKQAYQRILHPQKAIFTYPDLYHDIAQEPEPDQDVITSDIGRWVKILGLHSPSPNGYSVLTHYHPMTT